MLNCRMLAMAGVACAALALGESTGVAALDARSTDARAIMQAVFDRPAGDRGLSRARMTIKDGSGERQRTMSSRMKKSADATKTLILLEDPPDVRDTGFLSVVYRGRGKANEQWLYLPNLHRVTRVPDSRRSDAFMGSDFSYSDLSLPNPDDYDLKLVEQSVKIDADECWLIEATPRNPQVKASTGYLKTQFWIGKATLIPLQIKAWVINGKKVKYMKTSDVRKVNEIWTPHRLQAKTVRDGGVESETTIELLSIKYDAAEVTDADFTQHRLEQGL